MKKLLLIGFAVFLLVGCSTEQSSSPEKMQETISQLQKQLDELKAKQTQETTGTAQTTETTTTPSCQTNAHFENGQCVCNLGYAFSLDKTSCVEIPADAHAANNKTDVWLCDVGYTEVGNSCIKSEKTSSQTLPNNNDKEIKLEKELLEIERKKLELTKESLSLNAPLPFQTAEGKISASVHGVTVKFINAQLDDEKTAGFTHQTGNSFWKFTFEVRFNNVDKFLTLAAGNTILDIEKFSSTAATFSGLPHQTNFSGMGGYTATATIWLEKRDDLSTTPASIRLFVLDGNTTVGNIVLRPFVH